MMYRWHKLAAAALLAAAIVVGNAGGAAAQGKPEGEMKFALYVTLAPAWLDPGEATPGVLTPFWVLYALHDAMFKPMPGNRMAPSLAESYKVSDDVPMTNLLISMLDKSGVEVSQIGDSTGPLSGL